MNQAEHPGTQQHTQVVTERTSTIEQIFQSSPNPESWDHLGPEEVETTEIPQKVADKVVLMSGHPCGLFLSPRVRYLSIKGTLPKQSLGCIHQKEPKTTPLGFKNLEHLLVDELQMQ